MLPCLLARAGRACSRAAPARSLSTLTRRAPLFGSALGRAPKPRGKGEPAAAQSAFVDDAGDIEAEVAASQDLKEQMAKHVEWARRELSKLRGSSASASASSAAAEQRRHGRCVLRAIIRRL
jgi:hypothetical protein